MEREYLNSTITFPAPFVLTGEQLRIKYVGRWFHENFGGRFCKLMDKVPNGKSIARVFCDHDRTDMLR